MTEKSYFFCRHW